ncbi:MAG: nucleotide sugar dehydrogenase [Candidatus Bathyarchaeota archaeon]
MSNLMDMPLKEVEIAIRNAGLTVTILGLGWMGLPTACLFIEAGARVLGVDVDSRVVELIRNGQSPIDEPGIQNIISRHIGKRLIVTTDPRQAAAQSDIILVVVPTGISSTRRPNYSAVEKACKDLGLAMRRGSIVIVESTLGPGVTDTVVRKVIESNSGLKAGADFGLAYSPIRAMAGQVMKDIQTYPRIVSGVDERSLNLASVALATISKGGLVKVKDLKTAEAAKLFENVYRDVNIALASELASFCEKAGLDFFDVRAAAITQPYCHLHLPRVGVGGHCIPFNPYFLTTEAESLGVELKLVKQARKVNDSTPSHIVDLVAKGLKDCKRSLKGSRVAVLGLSYRNDVKEVNNSPSLKIIETLTKRGTRVSVYDPFFSTAEIEQMGFNAAESLESAIGGVDCIIIASGHEQFKHLKMADMSRLARKPGCIVDGWRLFDPEEARANNLTYYGVGLG